MRSKMAESILAWLFFVTSLLCVTCTQAQCSNGDLRLEDGNIENEGRVEICVSNVWGTVCDDGFSNVDAKVVCRKLNYLTTDALAFSSAFFGSGSGSILLDNVACSGGESSLLDCTYDSTHNCGHSEDVGVRCQINSTGSVCSYSEVRLVGGDDKYEGRVELCIENGWHTVCDDGWGVQEAKLVCHQLGYSYTGAGPYKTNAFYGQGTGTIAIENTACSGSESQLLACSSSPVFGTTCSHSEDAGVDCEAPCSDGDLRLVNGKIDNEGRVEVCLGNVWGTVCDDSFTSVDAKVVCRKLNYLTTDALAFTSAFFGSGSGSILLDNVACSGGESSLLDCTYDSTHDCVHSEDVGVRCQINSTGSVCSYSEVRLVGGDDVYEGRVELCIENGWHTVCDDGWGAQKAKLVCHQLGYSYTGAGPYKTNAFYGQGTGTIAIENTACSGSESQLLACSSSPIFGTTCSHSEDAGVDCEAPCSDGDLRLVNGKIDNEGRVEVCLGNVWGTVCDDSFTSVDAKVVCRKLNYSTADSLAFSSASFGSGSGSIFLDDVACSGGESTLLDCTYDSTPNCGHSEDVGVRCQVNSVGSVCTYGKVRLVGGDDKYEGRVEVCIENGWHTVCDDGWGSQEAKVVCHQLGYSYTGTGPYKTNAFYGQGTGTIAIENTACSGSESNLLACSSSPIFGTTCSHSEDAGVDCEAPCSDGDLRLVGGNVNNEGRVEICIDLVWGTVCDDSFTNIDAQVVCRKLNYLTTDALAFSNALFGSGIGYIFLDNVGCNGNESSLLDCSYDSTHNCGHYEDVGVRCQVGTTTSFLSSSSSSSSPSSTFTFSSSSSSSSSSTFFVSNISSSSSSSSFFASFESSSSSSPSSSTSSSIHSSSTSSPLSTTSSGHSTSTKILPTSPFSAETSTSISISLSDSLVTLTTATSPSSSSLSLSSSVSFSPDQSTSSTQTKVLTSSTSNSQSTSKGEVISSTIETATPIVTSVMKSSSVTSFVLSTTETATTSSNTQPATAVSIASSSSLSLASFAKSTDRTSTFSFPSILSSSKSKHLSRSITSVGTTSSLITRSPEPTCSLSSRVASSVVVQKNSLIAVIGDYSVFAFKSSGAQDKFEKVTLESITAYCSAYMTACTYIDLAEMDERSQIYCIMISSVRATSDGHTEVTFFAISSDGTGLIPVQAVSDAVKGGKNNRNYENAGFSDIIFSPYVSNVTDTSTDKSASHSGAIAAVSIMGVVLFVICVVAVLFIAFFILYKSNASRKYNINDNVLEKSQPRYVQSSFEKGTGITNMLEVDDDGYVVLDAIREQLGVEPITSSGL